MFAFLTLKALATVLPESAPSEAFANLPVEQSANLEGKELRLGATTGPLRAVLTTSTSNGSVGAMHGSLNPLSLIGPFAGLWLNSTFCGVGVGMIRNNPRAAEPVPYPKPRPCTCRLRGDRSPWACCPSLLEGAGHTMISAVDGSHGLHALALDKPDLVILDLGLPDIDGLEVLRRLREWTSVPVLVLSARPNPADKVNALDVGADDYLTKPFNAPELLTHLRRKLRDAGLTGEVIRNEPGIGYRLLLDEHWKSGHVSRKIGDHST